MFENICLVQIFLAFFPNCPKYGPPLSETCLRYLWLNAVGCSNEGYGYPGARGKSLLNTPFQEMNQKYCFHYVFQYLLEICLFKIITY